MCNMASIGLHHVLQSLQEGVVPILVDPGYISSWGGISLGPEGIDIFVAGAVGIALNMLAKSLVKCGMWGM